MEAVNLNGIHSGNLDISANLLQPSKNEEVFLRFGAEFRRLGEERIPPFSAYAAAQNQTKHGRVDFNSSLTLLPHFGVVLYGRAYHEQPYELEPRTVGAIQRKLEEAQESGGDGDLMACAEAAAGIDLSQLIDNVKGERHGERSRHAPLFAFIGELSISHVANALIELAEDHRCGTQLRALGLPSATELRVLETTVKSQIEKTRIKVGLTRNGVPRVIDVNVVFKSPPGLPTTFALSFTLNEVNQVGPLFPSPGTRPFGALLRRLGTNTNTILESSPRALVLGFLKGLSGGLTGQLP